MRMKAERFAEIEVEVLRLMTCLKTGEYNGSDVMSAWLRLNELLQALKAEREIVDAVRPLIKVMAKQLTIDEMTWEQVASGDFETAYDIMVVNSRDLLKILEQAK